MLENWTNIFKRLLIAVFIVFALWASLKIAFFYLPFLIAFAVSLCLEPIIKLLMKKCKISRKLSSIIVFIIAFGIILGLILWGVITIVSESSNLLANFNDYYNKGNLFVQNILSKFDSNKLKVSEEVLNLLRNSSVSLLDRMSNYFQKILNGILSGLTKIPTFTVYLAVTILSLYFICTDKIYMLDELEHHLPEKWMKELSFHLRDLIKVIGGYLKAQLTLVLISFVICLIGLYIFKFIGLNIGFPLIIAIAIGFVDALPILGTGTIMIPWAVISSLNGDIKLGISIISLWIVMSIIRQFIEPKIVSRKYWYTSNIYYCSYVYRF